MAAQPNTIVRLNDYCVAEFFTNQITISSSPVFHKLYNVETGVHQIYNSNADDIITWNTQDYSVACISPGQYVYMNQEVAIPYWDRFPDKFYKSTPGPYDTFNRVRFHFTSGFDFAGLPGLILSVKNKMNNGTYAMFSQLLVTAELYEFLVRFNTSPIYLADAIFDRYVEVFIPAISVINSDYYALPPESRSGEFGALATYTGSSYSGFVNNAPIVLSVDEVSRMDTITIGGDMYQLYIADNHFESVVLTNSLYQKFGVFVGESDQFDALEFYATMLDENNNVAFVEELINEISTNAHDDWVIAHQLIIHEWIGGVKTLSGKYMVLQETDFDSPLYYRPILKNAGTAIAFEVDYTCRLYNRLNGEQLIRLGSYTSYNAKKYGRSLEKIPLDADPSSHVVYNKIVRSALEATELFVEQNYVNPSQQTQQLLGDTQTQQQAIMSMIPMFFNVNAISISMKDSLLENDNLGTTLVYKQGDLMFVLNPFDNMFKFKVYTVNSSDNLVPMDLSGFGSFNLVFMDNNKKVKFGYMTSAGTSNPSIGELMFKVPQSDAEILITSTTRDWYITLVAADGTETVLYNGFWRDVTEKADVDSNIERVRLAQSEALSDKSVSYFSTQNGVFTVPEVPASTAQTTQSETPAVDSSVYIPGYVPVGNSGGDVSIIKVVSPSLLQSKGDAKQSKADAALSKALGNQARKTIPKRG